MVEGEDVSARRRRSGIIYVERRSRHLSWTMKLWGLLLLYGRNFVRCLVQQFDGWCTALIAGCHIWYSKEETVRMSTLPRPLGATHQRLMYSYYHVMYNKSVKRLSEIAIH